MNYSKRLKRYAELLATAYFQQQNLKCFCEVVEEENSLLLVLRDEKKPDQWLCKFDTSKMTTDESGDKPEDWIRYIDQEGNSPLTEVSSSEKVPLFISRAFEMYVRSLCIEYVLEYTPFMVKCHSDMWLPSDNLIINSFHNKYYSIYVNKSTCSYTIVYNSGGLIYDLEYKIEE